MQIESASTIIKNITFLNDEIAWFFTPKLLRKTRKIIDLGHILASLPALALFLPLVNIFLQRGDILRGVLLLLFLELVIVASLSSVSFGRRQAISIVANLEKVVDQGHMRVFTKIVTESLLLTKQVAFGSLFAAPIVVLAQGSWTLRSSDLSVQFSVSASVAYTGFLVGAGFYLVLCVLKALPSLTSAKFILPTLFPHQTVELKRIADTSVAVSLFGALVAACLTSLVIMLAIISGGYRSLYWSALMVGVLILSWATVSIPFLASQFVLAHAVRQVKDTNLSHLSSIIRKAFDQIEVADKESIERLEKLQNLYDQIYKSPNAVLNWSILGKYSSSLLITIIPMTVGTYIQHLLK